MSARRIVFLGGAARMAPPHGIGRPDRRVVLSDRREEKNRRWKYRRERAEMNLKIFRTEILENKEKQLATN